MAASKTIGGINVTISATIDKFAKPIKMAQRLAGQFVKSVKNITFSLKGLAAALTVGAMVKWTHSAAQQIDALGELSDKLGISTKKLGGYQLAAAEAGISNELLERSLTTLGAKGLTLRGWIEQTSKLTTHQQRLAAAVDMFGTRGASMVRMLTGGTAALDEAQKAAESLGLAMDRKTVMGVERALDAFGRFKLAVSGIFRSLAAEIAPFIEVLSNKAFDFLATSGRGKGIGKSISDAILWMVKTVADGIQRMIGGVLSAVAEFKAVIANFRGSNSWLARQMGVGHTDEQNRLAWNDVGEWRARAKAFTGTPWSTNIQALIDKAREMAAQQAKPQDTILAALMRDPVVSALVKRGQTNATTLKQFGGKLWGGFAGGLQGLPGMMGGMQWAGMQHFANNFQGPGVVGGGFRSLAAQDPLSREGNSQRVRSLAQVNIHKIAQKQLEKQDKMERHLAKLANQPPIQLRPANLAN